MARHSGKQARRFGQRAIATGMGALVLASMAGGAAAAMPGGGVSVRQTGIWAIVGHADPVVKTVMLLLVLASLATWALCFSKFGELRAARKGLGGDIGLLASAREFRDPATYAYWGTAEMVRTATAEIEQAGASPSPRAVEGIEERFAAQLPMVEARATHRMLRGTNVIASIGATAPFVGLAGTVWGIMNSFLGIAASKSTSLAVVAPGIAEALLATAMGLAVAIPAVLIYNSLARAVAGYKRLLNEAAVLAACVLSRELERRETDGETGGAGRLNGAHARAESGHADWSSVERGGR